MEDTTLELDDLSTGAGKDDFCLSCRHFLDAQFSPYFHIT